MIAWAAIDLLAGRAVRLEQGQELRRMDFGLATDVFKDMVSRGVRCFHVVDLDAAFGREPSLPRFLRDIGHQGKRVSLQVAGGIRSLDSARRMLDLGASRVVVGSLMFRDPYECARLVSGLGPDRTIAAVDFRSGRVRIDGWKTSVGTTEAGLKVAGALGFDEALVTDIGRDGMMCGPNLGLIQSLGESGLRILASGGITTFRHLRALAAMTHVSGAVVGKALYLGRIQPDEIREYAS